MEIISFVIESLVLALLLGWFYQDTRVERLFLDEAKETNRLLKDILVSSNVNQDKTIELAKAMQVVQSAAVDTNNRILGEEQKIWENEQRRLEIERSLVIDPDTGIVLGVDTARLEGVA